MPTRRKAVCLTASQGFGMPLSSSTAEVVPHSHAADLFGKPGPLSTSRPLRSVILTSLLALTLGLGVLSLRQRSAEFQGYLHARTTYITAERSGRLLQFSLLEGDRVDLQTPLAQMADVDLASKLNSKQHEVRVLEAELQQHVAQAELDTRWRLKSIDEELAKHQLMSAGFLKDKYQSELRCNLLTELNNAVTFEGDAPIRSQFVLAHGVEHETLNTAFQLEAATNNSEICQAQIQICASLVKQLKVTRNELADTVRRSSGTDVVEARLAEAREELTNLEQAQERLTVRSTAVATVGLFRAKPGDNLSPGDPLVELHDDAQRFIVVEVPSSRVNLFPVGKELKLRFAGDVMRLSGGRGWLRSRRRLER